ncbi:MAG: transporter substrate-binding domain-containing protein [Saccharospirillaceae bacterium]|nr:transporter substrate-binding domain-containing protein [Pseudomonadales bacterium]NRB81197.1 transporter substrate-binding domain-containing protein [Saccharospirillaceae bacterium]
MKIYRLMIVTFVLILSFDVLAADIEVTVYADENYPPYSYVEDGELKGIYNEILKITFAQMQGYQVNIVPVPWKRGLKLIEDGDAFALYPPYFHVLKRPYIWPYSLPILDERVIVYCYSDILNNSLRPKWPEDYYGLTIGINAGFHLGGDKFWQAVKDKKIVVSEAKGNKENLLKLGSKRIDCYINDRISILWQLKQMKTKGEYDEGGKQSRLLEGATISIEQGFLGFTNTDNNYFYYKDDFKKQFDIIIYNMRRTGQTQKIINDFVN